MVWDLQKRGVIREIWCTKADHRAVVMLECADIAEARQGGQAPADLPPLWLCLFLSVVWLMGQALAAPLFGMAGTLHETVYTARGHAFVSEFYADLDYNDQGGLIITREHVATDPDAAASACLRAMREGKVRSVGGVDVPVRADAICVHSDTPNAVAVAEAVRAAVKG